MAQCKIAGYVVRGYNGRPRQTAKAVYVNVITVDGEEIGQCDSTWLPRSIASKLVMTEERDEDGDAGTWFSAEVPVWWVRKLDNRPAWVRAGMRSPPMATKPF